MIFANDGSSSEFRRHADTGRTSPWTGFSVLDPTVESLDLVPPLPPATQLLLAHELRRASQRLQAVPQGREAQSGCGRTLLEEVFQPLPEGTNALPSSLVAPIGILAYWGEARNGISDLELAIVDQVSPRRGWSAPFLLRGDGRSAMRALLLDVDPRDGRCSPRPGDCTVTMHPSHFVCRVGLERDVHGWRLDAEGRDRYTAMRQYLLDLRALRTCEARTLAQAPNTVDNSVKVSLAKRPNEAKSAATRSSVSRV